MLRQFTATVYVVHDEKVLLIRHRKLNKWLPPGGHLEDGELPHEAAMREAYEETGLTLSLLLQENLWIDRWNARILPRPYLCLLEEIPSIGSEPTHQHIDMIFVAQVDKGCSLEPCGTELARWFSWEEVACLAPDGDIFVETQETIRCLLRGCSFLENAPVLDN